MKRLAAKGKRKTPPKPKAPPMRQFEELVPRENLVTALATAEDPRFRALHAAMMTPMGSKCSLISLTRRGDIGLRWDEIVTYYRDFQMQRGMIAMVEHVPEVMRDIAIDSKSRMEVCPRCDGDGVIPDPGMTDDSVHLTKPCLRCEGAGRIRVSGDAAARALMFEATGLKGQKGPLVAQQFNFGAQGLEPLEKTVQVVQRLIGGQ